MRTQNTSRRHLPTLFLLLAWGCSGSHQPADALPDGGSGEDARPPGDPDVALPDPPRPQAPPWVRFARSSSVNDVLVHQNIPYVASATGLIVQTGEASWQTVTPEGGELPNLFVTALAAGPTGELWIGTSSGLAVKRDEEYTHVHDLIGSDSVGDEVYYRGGPLTVDTLGRLWVTAGFGQLARWEEGAWTLLERAAIGLAVGEIRALAPGRGGTVWAALVPEVERSFVDDPAESGGGLARIGEDSVVQTLTFENGTLGSNWVLDLAPGEAGDVIALLPSEVVVIEATGAREVALPETVGPHRVGVAAAGAGGFVVTSPGPDGTNVWSYEAGEWDHRLAAEGLRVHEAEEGGRIWLGGEELVRGGRDGDWTTIDWSSADIPTNSLRGLAVTSDDRVWIATSDRGLVTFDGERFESFGEDSDVGDNRVQAVAADEDDHVWLIAGDHTLVEVVGGSFRRFPLPLERIGLGRFDLTLNADCTGEVWIGAVGAGDGGLLHFDGSAFRFYGHEQLPTNHSVVSVDCSLTDGTFVGTKYGNVTLLRDGRFQDMSTAAVGAPLDYVHVVRADTRRGGLWVGHGSINLGGLTYFDGAEWSPLDLSSIGGPRTIATVLGEDLDGNMLFVAGGTVARVSPDGRSFEPLQPPVPQYYVVALDVDSRGNTIFATTNGGLVVHREGGVLGFD